MNGHGQNIQLKSQEMSNIMSIKFYILVGFFLWNYNFLYADGTCDGSCKNGSGKLVYSGGKVAYYEGYWRHGVKNGKGKEVYRNGDSYEGEFSQGQKDGEGKYIFSNGDSIEGDWNNGEIKSGIYRKKDGGVYQGTFKNGTQNGFGQYTWKNGDRYNGSWKDGKRHGLGTFHSHKEYSIEGRWKDGKIIKGKIEYLNGMEYEGEFRHNEYNGEGMLTSPDERVYKGSFLDGQFHGKGVLKINENEIKDGLFRNGELYHGKHAYIASDGKYIVIIKNGKKKKGKVEYKNGNIYEGHMKDLKPHGLGIFTLGKNKPVKVEFENGKFKQVLAKYECDVEYRDVNTKRKITSESCKGGVVIKKDKFIPHGFGEVAYNNKEKYIGEFKNGKRHGKGKWIYNMNYVLVGEKGVTKEPINFGVF